MADLLIPLLLLFAVVGGVLVWALVRQFRELDDGPSDQPFGNWREGGPDPVFPWKERREKADGTASGRRQPQGSTGRPLFPWQRGEEADADRPRRAAEPMRRPVGSPPGGAPAPTPPSGAPAPQPSRAMPEPGQPARGAQPAPQGLPGLGRAKPARRQGPKRPRQPAWLRVPEQLRGKGGGSQEAPQPASRPLPGAQRDQRSSADRPAPLWQRPRDNAPAERAAPAPQPQRNSEERVAPARAEHEPPREPAAPARAQRRDAPEQPPPGASPRQRCSTCGGTGQTIVHSAGGGLGRGPCPDCQG